MVRYLLRFDDVCPTMSHARWTEVEAIVNKYDVKPIIAVVPDNRDPHLIVNREDPDFWMKMRRLQDCQWTIGLHGFQHAYTCRGKSLVPIHEQGEFVGLPEREQRDKIERGVSLLRGRGLKPQVWVAPGHSFDSTTLAILKTVEINCISDGFSLYPYVEHEMFWIPQQMWRFRTMPFGVWTICLHHNQMRDADIERLDSFVGANRGYFIGLPELKQMFSNRSKSLLDVLFQRSAHLVLKTAKRSRTS